MLIKELHLLTNDLARTENFYHNILEFPVAHRTASSIDLSVGTTLLKFMHTTTEAPFYHFAFNIAHNKIEEALQWIEPKAEVMNIAGEGKIADFRNWNAKAFYFYDSNGSILEFIARFDLPNATDKPFDASAICSISEIGLVVNDVRTECAALIEKYTLSYFSRQTPMQNFAAVGDDEGLFIVVPKGRPWYPTGKVADVCYTEVHFDTDKAREVVRLGKRDEW